MKKKKVAGFVLGLVGSIASGVLAYFTTFVLVIAMAVTKQHGEMFAVLSALNFGGVAVGIIASIFYFKKPRVGGILMLIAFLLDLCVYIYIFAISDSFALQLILPMLPSVVVLVSAILGLTCKPEKPMAVVKETKESTEE
ncbi:MAG: hypothetical protein MJ152_02640 [Clostridia bacterium]|nr:hypothetical protein [Clostridia bacterium]